MELVYLWVEKYKNIKEQGFNFSPKFTYSYDDKKLTYIEHDNYIKNFFDEKGKVNVTAIVGENGSGKSSIIKLILMLLFMKKFENTKNKEIFLSLKSIIEDYGNNELFLIIEDENGDFKKISFLEIVPKNEYIGKFKYKLCKIKYPSIQDDKQDDKIDFYNIHFNYMLDTLSDNEIDDSWVKNIYHKADDYDVPLLLEPFKNNYNKQMIDLDIIHYLTNQKVLSLYSNFKDIKILSFFNPNKIKYTINKNKFVKKLIEFEYQGSYYSPKENLLTEDKVLEKIEQLIENKDFETLNNIYIYTKSAEEYSFPPPSELTNDNFIDKINTFMKLDNYKETPNNTLAKKSPLSHLL